MKDCQNSIVILWFLDSKICPNWEWTEQCHYNYIVLPLKMSTTAQPHTWEQAENILLSFVEQSFSTKTFNGSSMGEMCSSKKKCTQLLNWLKRFHTSFEFHWNSDGQFGWKMQLKTETRRPRRRSIMTLAKVLQLLFSANVPLWNTYKGYNRKDLLSIDHTPKVYLRALFLWVMRTESLRMAP